MREIAFYPQRNVFMAHNQIEKTGIIEKMSLLITLWQYDDIGQFTQLLYTERTKGDISSQADVINNGITSGDPAFMCMGVSIRILEDMEHRVAALAQFTTFATMTFVVDKQLEEL